MSKSKNSISLPNLNINGNRIVTQEPVKVLRAIIDGIDQPAHLRHPPINFLNLLPSSSRQAILPVYDYPYSTFDTRMGLVPKKNQGGTRPGARDKIVSMAGLLTIAQCKLCARGEDLEKLVAKRFQAMAALPILKGTVKKQVEKWQKSRKNLPMFASAEATRNAVLCVVRVNLGKRKGDHNEMKKRLCEMKSKILSDCIVEEHEYLIQAALLSATDFTLHSDAQIERMISAINNSGLTYGKAARKYKKYFLGTMLLNQDILGDAYQDFLGET